MNGARGLPNFLFVCWICPKIGCAPFHPIDFTRKNHHFLSLGNKFGALPLNVPLKQTRFPKGPAGPAFPGSPGHPPCDLFHQRLGGNEWILWKFPN